MQVLLTSCGAWYLPHTAKAFSERDALAGLWISNRNSTGIPSDKFRRCWPFHVMLKPFLHVTPDLWRERAFYFFFPVWRAWLKRRIWPKCEVVQAIMGYATEPFDQADRNGALKVIDCQNSHPTSYYGFAQRENDIWCPGEKVAIPHWMFARMNRELERADLIVCPSNFVRDSMLANGISVARCMVNPFGADLGIFRLRPKAPDRPRFVSVGTICLRKGHQYLFRAFEELRKKMPEAELICVGDYKIDFRRERPKWQGRFTHIEHLNHVQLNELFSTCTAFVFPSCEEGFAR